MIVDGGDISAGEVFQDKAKTERVLAGTSRDVSTKTKPSIENGKMLETPSTKFSGNATSAAEMSMNAVQSNDLNLQSNNNYCNVTCVVVDGDENDSTKTKQKIAGGAVLPWTMFPAND